MAVLCGAAALVLTGCAAEEPDAADANTSLEAPAEESAPADEAQPEADDGLTAESIMATIAPQGFECEVEDARLDARDEVVTCKGADYVIITATSLVDPSTMADQIASAKDTVCKNQEMLGVDTLRTATSGKWIMTPGGDDDKNLAAFNTAMESFGLTMVEDPC